MGVCESEKVPHNFIKIDGQIKDISNESLLDDSIQESIKDKYTIEQGTKLQITGISEEVEGEEYSANGVKFILEKMSLGKNVLLNV